MPRSTTTSFVGIKPDEYVDPEQLIDITERMLRGVVDIV
jgi:hypothetical protein